MLRMGGGCWSRRGHGRDLLGGEPELLDDPGVADDHEQGGEDEKDEELIESDEEGSVSAEESILVGSSTLADILGIHAVYIHRAWVRERRVGDP